MKWRAKWDRLLGTMTDAALARQVGVSDQTVRWHRLLLRIPPLNIGFGRPRKLTHVTDAQLQAGAIVALAAKLGVSPKTVHAERKLRGLCAAPRTRRRLADVSDASLMAGRTVRATAQLLGVSYSLVRQERHLRGLRRAMLFTPELTRAAVLGMLAEHPDVPDAAMARVLHLSRERVRQLAHPIRRAARASS